MAMLLLLFAVLERKDTFLLRLSTWRRQFRCQYHRHRPKASVVNKYYLQINEAAQKGNPSLAERLLL
jgi:hypothetical protein